MSRTTADQRQRPHACRNATIFFACVCVASLLGCQGRQQEPGVETVRVLAAASTTTAIEEAARLFQNDYATVVFKISSGPSNGLARQIMLGAPADVFVSANRKWCDAIADDGLAGETVDLLSNHLVLIVPRTNPGGITAPRELTDNKVVHVAIASENVPAGVYAEQALRSLKLFDPLRRSNKLVRGSDVRVALTYVERGEADAGIVYATDAHFTTKVEVISQLDPQTHDRIVYSAVLLKASQDRPAVSEFFKFLQSPAALAVFGRYGFVPQTLLK